MLLHLHGILRRNGNVADCIVAIDSDSAAYMSDNDVAPPMVDGEYDLEVNGVHMRAVRDNCQWTASEY